MAISERVKAATQLLLFALLGAAAILALFSSVGCVYSGERSYWTRQITTLDTKNKYLQAEVSTLRMSKSAGRPTPKPGEPESTPVIDKLDEIIASMEHDREHTEAEHAVDPMEDIPSDDAAALLKLLGLGGGGLGSIGAAAWIGFQYGRRKNGAAE